MTRKTREEELEAVADMLEMLALEVRAMTGSTKERQSQCGCKAVRNFAADAA
jgi:hypothetical protein